MCLHELTLCSRQQCLQVAGAALDQSVENPSYEQKLNCSTCRLHKVTHTTQEYRHGTYNIAMRDMEPCHRNCDLGYICSTGCMPKHALPKSTPHTHLGVCFSPSVFSCVTATDIIQPAMPQHHNTRTMHWVNNLGRWTCLPAAACCPSSAV